MNYFKLLLLYPFGKRRVITFKGLKLYVYSLWDNGAVCRTEFGELKILHGKEDLKGVIL